MTKNLWTKRKTNLIVLLMLLLTMSFCMTGCKGNDTVDPSAVENSQTYQGDQNVLGEGQTEIYFTVVDATGDETKFEIHTDKENVREALQEYDLISGDESDYGLYVKTVNGITADYDKDQTYWAFYINDEYASTGVDSTPVTAGDTYSFKVEK